MKSAEQLYKPYNFSETRCHVIRLTVRANGYMKIEQKLPSYIKHLKGIFVSVTVRISGRRAGIITLNFNGQALKAFHYAVPFTYMKKDCSHPMPFDETLLPNSLLQGYYYDTSSSPIFPYTLSIYLHYEK